jgi:predicted permease
MTLFGGDPSVVGRTIVLNDEPRTIVGIMPPRFEWNVADFWLPSVLSRTDDPQLPKGSRAFQARLRRGVSIKEAEAELQVIAARRATDHPPEYPPHFRIEVITVIDWVVRDFRGVLYTLFGAVSLLLVISCCNVANMLLARATSREREISIRAAIGASRGRIVRQLLVESGLLAVGGLVVGCLLAYGGIAALARFMPRQGVPWETELRLDQPVLVFALIAAAIATIGFGLFPAVQSARADVSVGIDTGGRGTAGRRQTRMRSGLVIAQVALSIVLLLGAGVLMRTFVKLAKVDLGFDARNILLTGVSLPPRNGASAADRTRLWQQLLDRVRTIPSVASAGISSGPPFGGIRSPLQIPGVAVPEQSFAFVTASSDGLLETIGVPLVRGRHVSRADVEASRHVAVVNETLATKFFAVNDALGRTIRLPRLAAIPAPIADPTFEIVGIVRDTANLGPRELPAPQVFVPFTLRPATGVTFVVRTSDNPMRFVNGVRVEAQVVDRQIALVDPTTMEDFVQRVFFARPRFSVLVLGIFACTGVVLVAFGVYGVLSYTVSQRSREIAIRMALGGDHRDVILMVLRLGASLVGAGVLVGIAVSAVTNRLLVTQLWNTSPHDAMTLAVTVAVVVTVGVFACWVPARRAVRIEPMAALRHE